MNTEDTKKTTCFSLLSFSEKKPSLLSRLSCSKKKKETDLSDLSEVNREIVTAPAIR